MSVSPLATSILPTPLAAPSARLTAEVAPASLTLEKPKSTSRAKKLAPATIDTDAVHPQEAQYAAVLDALQAKCAELSAELDAIAQHPNLPEAIGKALALQRKRLASSRTPDIQTLRAAQQRGLLGHDASALDRLVGELNKDTTALNALLERVDQALDAAYAPEIDALRAELLAATPQAEPALDATLAPFVQTMQAQRWREFAAAREQFVAEQRAAAEREAQWTLTQKTWAAKLGMEGYGVVPCGQYDGYNIHVTYDNYSWTQAAHDGVSVHLDGGSVDRIFDALFEVEWAYQFHATLELPDADGRHPHVYAFGKDSATRWDAAAQHNGKSTEWITAAKQQVQRALADYTREVKQRIQRVIDDAPKR